MIRNMDLTSLQTAFDARRETILADWTSLLQFPSISVEPAHAGDCRACAEWLRARLLRLGFATELFESAATNPVVFAERRGALAALPRAAESAPSPPPRRPRLMHEIRAQAAARAAVEQEARLEEGRRRYEAWRNRAHPQQALEFGDE